MYFIFKKFDIVIHQENNISLLKSGNTWLLKSSAPLISEKHFTVTASMVTIMGRKGKAAKK